jgi:hypothetical protein
MPRGSSFIPIVVRGVREGQTMRVVTNRSRETDEEEVAPRVVRQVAPPVVPV